MISPESLKGKIYCLFYTFFKAFVVFIDDGKVIFLAQFITLVTDLMITFFIGLIAFAGNHIHIIEDDVIVDMPFIYVRR